MALQGTIETFALPDVLRLLATSNKTGKLTVDGDRGLGALWVDDGDIVASEIDLGVHPSTGSTDAAEGLFQLLRFESGEFVFTSDETPASSDGRIDVESSIATSTEMLTELDEITNNVPGVTSHVVLRPELNADGVTLSAEQWRVLASVGSGASVADIASTFSFGELDAMRRVDDLVNEGVIDVTAAPAEDGPALDDPALDEPADFFVAHEPASEEPVSEKPVSEEPVADESSFDEPVFEAAEEPAFEEAMADDAAAEVAAEVDDPFAPVAESDDPFAAPVESDVADDPFAAVAEADVADDQFAAVAGTDAADPFAAPQPEPEADVFAAATENEAPVPDPFAPAAEAIDDDSDGIDPFAPAAGIAAGATGGVLHDVFGSSESEVDASWEPPADDTMSQAPTEWPAPNDTVSDADAPWSDEAASQLPPPPAPATDSFAPADEAASQLPPPPAIAGDAGIDSAVDAPAGTDVFDAPAPVSAEVDQSIDSELPPPPAFDAPEAEVAGVPSFPEAPPAPAVESVASESNDMARQLASLSPSAARAVANAAKAETPEARDAALAEVEAEDSSVDRSLLLRFLGKSDKKES